MNDQRPLLLGLTGPIGCGKSTVARMLGELGGTVIDADDLARVATQPDAGTLPAIRVRFGDGILSADGTLDRAALAETVFADADALADLEQILHPEVHRLIDERLGQAAHDNVPFVVLEAIKLVEGGLAQRCDEVWLIACEPAIQRTRMRERGSSQADIDRRMAAQGDLLNDRLSVALGERAGVRRLSTDGTLADTRERVEDALADALEPLLD